MQFNSVAFLWFLPLVVCLYYLIPGRFRWILVLAASYSFYMWWRPVYALLLLGTTVVDFWSAWQMDGRTSQKARLPFYILSLTVNLGLLITFKYLGFFTETVNTLAGTEWTVLHLLLPLGISFHTFQSVAYVTDVYRGKIAAERHLGYFAIFVAYFPQMVAGPIERYDALAPQLRAVQPLRYDHLAAGFRLLLLGFFAKVAVADNLAPMVDAFYETPINYKQVDAVLAVCLYAFQIYADFWGYSLIATGAARLMGVRLSPNFRSPYLATSIADYWLRWHMSLTSWFRDYLFTPLSLGLRRMRWAGIALAILVTYLVSGLWHGAQWTFVVWGGLWGLLYALEFVVGRWVRIVPARPWSLGFFLRVPIVFGISALALVPFRSGNFKILGQAWQALRYKHPDAVHLDVQVLPLVLLAIFVGLDMLCYDRDPDERIGGLPTWVRWPIYAALLAAVLMCGAVVEVPFIYFQF